jgi:hypothetical protein
MDLEGFVLLAWVMNVTGEDSDSLGVNIQIEEYKPAHPAQSDRLLRDSVGSATFFFRIS